MERVSAAGSTVMVVSKAISMPTPAISPSSETPRKSVGRNEKKAAATAAAARVKGIPALRAALRSALCRSSMS